ncbi:MAG: LLM class flavin-dependent oxidoreductase [Candidatus Thorarchaeota archaeon]|nr:MAG: LLM class flavin-dependent oxidoreductase [Candidatus Thorarchaeota archaeon]
MRFGVALLQHLPWDELVRIVSHVETLDFDSVWLADHFVNYMNPTAPWYEAWTLLAALATSTKRIRIGTLVTSVSFRNPALLARQAMTVDHISNGRLELGLGAGAPGSEDSSYAMMGIEDWQPSERVARFREQVEIIDQCFRQPVSSYRGKYYKLEGTSMAPGPVQKPRPPITIGAMGKAMLRIAAQYGDSWSSFGADFGAPPDVVLENTRIRNELVDRYCEDIGRDPSSLRRSLLIFGAEAQTAFASEDNFTEVVRRYRGIGMNELVFFYPFFNPQQIPTFEHIAQEVIPMLRSD